MGYVARGQDPAEIRKAVRSMQSRARAAYRARHPRLSSAKARAGDLEDAFAEQALLHQALLRLCLKKKIFTSKGYAGALEKIDLLDGVADGSLTRQGAPGSRKPKKSGNSGAAKGKGK